jgi:hypothetical protein
MAGSQPVTTQSRPPSAALTDEPASVSAKATSGAVSAIDWPFKEHDMNDIFADRYTARVEKPIVLFLIGMRFNNLLAIRKWLPVALAMPRMLAELTKKPDSGLLFYRSGYISGRVVLVQQYWESFDKLAAYAHDRSGQHFPAWAAFNRAIGTDGSVGIWHETYIVEPGKSECMYVNMPRFGLAAAVGHVKAQGRLAAAKDRLAA